MSAAPVCPTSGGTTRRAGRPIIAGKCAARTPALAEGRLELRTYANPTGEKLRRLLQQGFEIEDRSWKGAAGTSVRQHARLAEFLLRQSETLAAWQQLVLVFLEHNGRPIAFELGHSAKGVYFSTKVGYDPAFAAYTPGQLLRLLWLRQLHSAGQVRTVDFWGPLTDATAKWSNQRYRAGRMVIAMPGLAGRGLFTLYGLAPRQAADRGQRTCRLRMTSIAGTFQVPSRRISTLRLPSPFLSFARVPLASRKVLGMRSMGLAPITLKLLK